MPVILSVRITSSLPAEELERRALERKPQFLEVDGLIQKFYGKDPESGAFCGIYLFRDRAALAAFAGSELAKTIPVAYEATEVRKEVYDLLYPLRSESGPVAG